MFTSFSSVKTLLLAAALVAGLENHAFSAEASWWNKEWTMRKKVTLDTGAGGVAITQPIGSSAVLLRLSSGNLTFESAKEDGTDLRFIAEDDKTPLAFHVERFDSLMHESFVWVKVPDVKPGAQTSFWIYYGNSGAKAVRADDSKGTYDADTVLDFHFSESGSAPQDSSGGGNHADKAGKSVPGSWIGGGLMLSAQSGITVPPSPSLNWNAGGAMTLSLWIKPTSLGADAILFSRKDAIHSFVIGVNEGVPYVEIGTERSTPGAIIAAGAWKHLAVVAEGARVTLYLDGENYSTLNASLPALNTALQLGIPTAESVNPSAVTFKGEIDELQLCKIAQPAGYVKLLAANQGDTAAKFPVVGIDEASGHKGSENEFVKQLSMFKDISKDLTIDGKIVIGLCALLAVVGWVVTAIKFAYLNRIKKATNAFLGQWQNLSADLTVLDHGDPASVKSMGGNATPKIQKVLRQSPLYHIYQIGFSEIQNRAANATEGFKGLSGRSMQSIKATLDGGLVREVQRLNSNLVFLTIGIAGGPYLGLLGTVIGVMITFAVIAKSGAVEVNSIAPGIAGALLATVAGLAVAIPALFAYSYISSRIKDAISEMQIFIDEFVAKIAEAFPSANE